MTVTMLLPAVLAGRAGGLRSVRTAGSTLGEVLDNVAVEHSDLVQVIRGRDGLSRFVNLYVNEVDARGTGGLETPVAPGAEISVIPAVAGG
ncbi:MoaD/ThiS family protein [Cellulomonas cellasea]|uniref:MoaD/ThiS family protein n=1 Tax=Cellulomonas cellasea TaxID=43670 RepID=UPI0025A44EBD|nr:MoaD/ThiS family protein [Cellulomonas cellasea]MDM8085111.1 MoaD/ThiS family protein [Cellulomonas cellasea]